MSTSDLASILSSQISFWATIISAIIAFISVAFSVSASIISMRRTKRLEKEYQKELAEYNQALQLQIDRANNLNSQLLYIQNTRFNYEFEVIKELSEKSLTLTLAFSNYFFYGFRGIHSSLDEERLKSEQSYMAVNYTYYSFRDVIFRYAAFISEDLFKQFDALRILCFKQLDVFYCAKLTPSDSNDYSQYREQAKVND